MVESQSHYKIKMLRVDNGKEYISHEFNLSCEDMSIIHTLKLATP